MVPHYFHRHFECSAAFAGGVFPRDPHPRRARNGIGFRAVRFAGERRIEFQRPPREVDEMAAHVAEHAVAVIPAAVPVEVATFPIALIMITVGRGALPLIPVEPIRRRLPFEHGRANGIDCAAAPHMRLAHGADGAALHQLNHAPIIIRGVNLRAHLRGDL